MDTEHECANTHCLEKKTYKKTYNHLLTRGFYTTVRIQFTAECNFRDSVFYGLMNSSIENSQAKKCVFVCMPRTLHLQGMGRMDFSLWYADIQKAAGGKTNTLKDQQLSRNDIPIIVDSCIAFITQYGKGTTKVYTKHVLADQVEDSEVIRYSVLNKEQPGKAINF